MSDTLPIGLLAVRLVDEARAAGARGLIHIATNERRAAQLGRLARQLDPELEVGILPPWDCLPYDRASPSRGVMGQRVSALRAVLARRKDAPILFVTTADAVIQRLPPPKKVEKALFKIAAGARLDRIALESFAICTGYTVDDRIDEPGEIAFRGQTIEIFPAAADKPIRLELEGDVVRAIRLYDPVDQRSIGETETATIEAASELIADDTGYQRSPGSEHWLPEHYGAMPAIFEYLPEASISLGGKAEARREATLAQVAEAYEARQMLGEKGHGRAPLAPDRLYVAEAEWEAALARRELVKLDREVGKTAPRFAVSRDPARAFKAYAETQLAADRRIVLTAASERDLRFLRRRVARVMGREAEAANSWSEVRGAAPAALLAMLLEIEAGFIAEADAATVIAAPDLLGARAEASKNTPSVNTVLSETGLHIGDAVIHEDHGLGRLDGLEQVEIGNSPHDLVRLTYAGDSHRLVPVDELDRLWRYSSEAEAVAFDRLDGGSWEKRRADVDAAIAETARGLIKLSAERAKATAAVIEPNAAAYERFAARFPFSETADQARAVEAVLTDLRSGKPMDRLVIGDVGFGKTEVALRAAAAAAIAGKQVAIVAPTTVLVRQHLLTFRRRFKGLAIEVADLSRLVSPAEAKRVKTALADGSVQVVVGTHALAGKGVRFADLGLLIIDEEQRFGTAHKARLRSLGKNAHVLTLSATPIPRTLQGAMVGLQQISILATPPTARQPIRTQLAPFDEATIRMALLRERQRGGQSFIVVPRVEDMAPMVERLATIVPELEIRQAHGQMPTDEIDTAMVEFADGRGDILLATSIIESGLDVPCANTMLVWRADRFGLSQLHQLRGRVGRGRRQGHVYLLTDPQTAISEATTKRLATLIALDRLGAGFAIAARDLDLRGAGDLLGEAQAGHIKLIGIDLYQHLLAAALAKARGEQVEDWAPVLNLELAGWLPADYIPEPEVRIDLYVRTARAREPHAIDTLMDEIEDRFGAPPESVHRLLGLARLRTLARQAAVERVDAGPAAIAFTLRHGGARRGKSLAVKSGLQWTGERLVSREETEASCRLERVSSLLEQLTA